VTFNPLGMARFELTTFESKLKSLYTQSRIAKLRLSETALKLSREIALKQLTQSQKLELQYSDQKQKLGRLIDIVASPTIVCKFY